MSILAFAFIVPFALLLLFVVVSAARRDNRGRGSSDASIAWYSPDGGAGFSDSGTGADCGSSSDGGGGCDGGSH